MSQKFAYVGCRTTRERNARGKGIALYQICPRSAEWTLVEVFPALDNPSFLALNRSQTFLYTVHGDGEQVSSFKIAPESGRLTHVSTVSCNGRNPVHLAFSADEHWLNIANYATGNVSRIPVNADGTLGTSNDIIAFTGIPGPHSKEQKGSHPHHISRYQTSFADSDWHIVPDKGIDCVSAVRWLSNGACEVVSQHWDAGSGPRHAAYHPSLPLVYVANELNSTMTVWKFDVESGKLTPLDTISVLPLEFDGDSSAAGIVVTADAKQLFVSNRGSNTVASISLDETGMPRHVGWTSCCGEFPRFIGLDPENQHLFVANERTDTIIEFDVMADGLKPTGQVIETGSPVCIVFSQR
ncbi:MULTISPECIES: lactonase family protein [unclassified Burkholderia]|uniref:lactonase family protein n=1 Tax=unclassified Burkholderia TaxID=2613784 RepID=UPI000F55E62E|nr:MULTISPECIES: lactonase family protein [unclassified Burkholderia]RQS26473.1 lactonase family protein [Burkholderia sp. Bp8995]RQS48451.1 lactonase family protein [Burkholderia sp. Bp8989]